MCNELDKRTRYYRLYGAEHELRLWATKHHNSFLVGIFACCREIYHKLRHSGCYGGTKEEALQAYQEESEQKTAEDLAESTENEQLKSANS